jgi:hypothetical protein
MALCSEGGRNALFHLLCPTSLLLSRVFVSQKMAERFVLSRTDDRRVRGYVVTAVNTRKH